MPELRSVRRDPVFPEHLASLGIEGKELTFASIGEPAQNVPLPGSWEAVGPPRLARRQIEGHGDFVVPLPGHEVDQLAGYDG